MNESRRTARLFSLLTGHSPSHPEKHNQSPGKHNQHQAYENQQRAYEGSMLPSGASVWDDSEFEGYEPVASSGYERVAPSGYERVAESVAPSGVDQEPTVDPRYDSFGRNWVRYRPGWSGGPRLVVFILIVIMAIVWARSRIYGWIDAQVEPEGAQGELVDFTVPTGSSVNDVAAGLHDAGVLGNPVVFRYWLRCDGELSLIKSFFNCDRVTKVEAGDYEFKENMSFEDVRRVLAKGPSSFAPSDYLKITLPEGLRWTQTLDLLLLRNPAFKREELESAFLSLVDEAEYLPEDLEERSLEGMLFPATYHIAPSLVTDERGFLLRLLDEFDRRYGQIIETLGTPAEFDKLGLSLYDVIVIASLIEEEASAPEDRAKISRVIYNRLLADMRLRIDATVCYAANKSCVDITREDIDRKSAWNTRAVKGLPPTPISAPGESSLRAALRPADGEWLYYVRTDAGGVKGAHQFAKTLEEHNQYVKICRELGYC